MDNEVLVEVTRGPIVENRIRGAVSVIDGNRLIACAGDPYYMTYMRSVAKPVQAAIVIESTAADHYGFTDKEIAVMCGSHIGDQDHCETVRGILEKIGLTEENLDLYKDYSLSAELREQRIAAHEEPRLIYNNCSGKHACMLAVCRRFGWDFDKYYEISHPVQQMVLDLIADFSEIKKEDIVIGLDGCGVPVFGMPLDKIALCYLNLVRPARMPSEAHREAAERITRAMAAYPEMLFGSGFFATELIRVTNGRIIGKIGADGVFAFACEDQPLAAAVKIEDGSVPMVPIVVMEVLKQLDLLTEQETAELSSFSRYETINCHGIKAGETVPVFRLH